MQIVKIVSILLFDLHYKLIMTCISYFPILDNLAMHGDLRYNSWTMEILALLYMYAQRKLNVLDASHALNSHIMAKKPFFWFSENRRNRKFSGSHGHHYLSDSEGFSSFPEDPGRMSYPHVCERPTGLIHSSNTVHTKTTPERTPPFTHMWWQMGQLEGQREPQSSSLPFVSCLSPR